MDLRLGRFIAIAVVVVALGMLSLRHRAQQLRQPRPGPAAAAPDSPAPAPPPPIPVPTHADSDSIAFVAAAVAALQADDSAHGWGSIPVQVLKFERDSAGVLVTLLPQDPTVPGGGALVRVAWRRGTVGTGRLIERYR